MVAKPIVLKRDDRIPLEPLSPSVRGNQRNENVVHSAKCLNKKLFRCYLMGIQSVRYPGASLGVGNTNLLYELY